MSERDFKGVWIPREIWLSKDLSLFEKCLLVEIDSLDCGPKHCFKSNESLAEFLGCSVPTVSRGIKALSEKGFISFDLLKTPQGSVRTIKSLIKMIRATDQNDQTPTDQNDSHSNTSSSFSKKKESNTEVRHKHGEYKHVLLTTSELERFKTDFPLDWEQRIKACDEYCQQYGKKYADYNLTMRKWAAKDREKSENTTPLFDQSTEGRGHISEMDRRMMKLAGRS